MLTLGEKEGGWGHGQTYDIPAEEMLGNKHGYLEQGHVCLARL